MNDPGLDEPISNDAKDVENQASDERVKGEEDEQDFLAPSRWWFASTAFPLIAGTFGPMASAFSICALAIHWRVYIPPGAAEQNGVPIPDPTWLIGVNAAQLVLAIISNFFLLMNMAKRVRFSIAQPITIIGWYISSFALIGLCACANGPLVIEPRSDHAFSQAYYYAIFSAVLYFMVATMMLITVYGAYAGHYDSEFQLTLSQRTLMLQTISFLVYLLLGALVFSHIEGWAYLDAVYWADFTLLTVGIGDYSPATHLGRGLLFPFSIGGIIILGLVIGSIRSLVLDRGKVKMGTRMVEKERERLLKKLEKHNKDDVLQPIQESPRISGQSSHTLARSAPDERARRRREFEMMRNIQEHAHSRRRWTSLFISGSTWFMLWFVGAAIFQKTEYGQNWSYFGALYFAYTSLLTIGYGDFYPQSNSGKAFFVFWSLLAVPSLTILISNMGDTIVKGIRDLTIWIGNFTVLPGEKGVTATLKETAHTLTKGKLSNNEVHEQPPGILGETDRRNSSDSENPTNRKNDPKSFAQRAAGDRANKETARVAKQGQFNDKLPSSRAHYHLILAKEIGKVMKHLHSSPPRKYTFDEWAWYLKLIGEDESDASTHRKPKRKPKPDGEGLGAAMKGDEKSVKWSWVGNRSPLMGNKEEAEWVLERLHLTLERELDGLREEELKSEGNDGDTEDNERVTQRMVDVYGGPSIGSSRTATDEKDEISPWHI